MREYTLFVKDLFRKGLRSRERSGTESEPRLTECLRLRPTESGLREHNIITDPFSVHYYGWPFAQILRGTGATLLASSTALRLVNETDWSTQIIKVHDYITEKGSYAFNSGGSWHMADAGKFIMLFNGEVIIFASGAEAMFDEAVKYHIVSDRTVRTGCYFKGRILMAGFSPADFWSDQWQSIMEELTETLAFDISTVMGMEKNFVTWSAIGGGNVLDMFYPERAIKGLIESHELADPQFLDYWRRNDCGMRPLTFQGETLCLKALETTVIAYGEDGISALAPATAEFPTFGVRNVASIGVHSRGSIGGTTSIHILVDKEGVVWRMSSEGLERLGYEEYTADMLSESITVSIDTRENDIYISNGVQTLLITAFGASLCPYHPTSLAVVDADLIGIFDTDTSIEAVIVSDVFDFRNDDLKTITTVELGIRRKKETDVSIALDFRYDTHSDFARSAWIPLNNEGWARLQKTAKQFRLCIKASDYSEFQIDYANVKWQQSGLRTIRGLYADTANL